MKNICHKRKIEHALQITMPGLLTTDGRKHPGQPTADLPLDSSKVTEIGKYKTNQNLTAKKSNTKAVTTALGRKNDVLVYELYGLTEDEIQIVEESVG